MWPVLTGVFSLASLRASAACKASSTIASGTHAPNQICSGQLIFAEEFNSFNLEIWEHEIYLSQLEFQYYSNNRTNSFTRNGLLFIRPSLTSDHYGLPFITRGSLHVDGGMTPVDRCTYPIKKACEHQANDVNIMNPVKSASIRTANSFRFRYGRVEIRAKVPSGDWLFPLIELLPLYNEYGKWPASGEINFLESSGNKRMMRNGHPSGTQEVKCLLDYGPYESKNAWNKTFWVARNPQGYDTKFHRYQLEWTPNFIVFLIDDWEVGRVEVGSGGFWDLGEFSNIANVTNPWRRGTKMAPFDKEFYLVVSLGIGGVSGFFPDSVSNPDPKPWKDNNANTAPRDFWNARDKWLKTWNLTIDDGRNASLQFDYIRVWAL